jgi:hypothetical protein
VTQKKKAKAAKKPPVNPALGLRLQQAMAAYEGGKVVGQNELAALVRRVCKAEDDPEFKFSQANAWKIIHGHVSRSDYVPHIAKALGVDAFWLATGIGDMRPRTPAIEPRHLALLGAYLALPKELRLPIRQLIETSRLLLQPAKLAEQNKRFEEVSLKLRADPVPQEASGRK